jgi:hypothetical protein
VPLRLLIGAIGYLIFSVARSARQSAKIAPPRITVATTFKKRTGIHSKLIPSRLLNETILAFQDAAPFLQHTQYHPAQVHTNANTAKTNPATLLLSTLSSNRNIGCQYSRLPMSISYVPGPVSEKTCSWSANSESPLSCEEKGDVVQFIHFWLPASFSSCAFPWQSADSQLPRKSRPAIIPALSSKRGHKKTPQARTLMRFMAFFSSHHFFPQFDFSNLVRLYIEPPSCLSSCFFVERRLLLRGDVSGRGNEGSIRKAGRLPDRKGTE